MKAAIEGGEKCGCTIPTSEQKGFDDDLEGIKNAFSVERSDVMGWIGSPDEATLKAYFARN